MGVSLRGPTIAVYSLLCIRINNEIGGGGRTGNRYLINKYF